MSRQAQFHSRKYLLALTADLRQHGGTPYEATRVDEGGPRPWEVAAVTANGATTSACTCMALSTEIQTLVGKVQRPSCVLGGTFLYTACRNRDTSYDTGAAHGDGIIEHGSAVRASSPATWSAWTAGHSTRSTPSTQRTYPAACGASPSPSDGR